ncbi:MAG: DUF3576 domain-containing protein [Proteobacteria bacterium]|nr:DUF3576 domain-containing protein [Pseudomonadota bacterium]
MKHPYLYLFVATSCLLLSACQGGNPTTNYEDIQTRREAREEQVGKLFGDDVFVFGDTKKNGDGAGIGVNAHLWRATLDTLSFMPLMLVDPFGGVILSDWYTPQNEPNERLKVDVRILTKELRSDGLKISVFRQKMVAGQWVSQSVSKKTQLELEEAILHRARQLKSGHVH